MFHCYLLNINRKKKKPNIACSGLLIYYRSNEITVAFQYIDDYNMLYDFFIKKLHTAIMGVLRY